jgi:hypothetical protein
MYTQQTFLEAVRGTEIIVPRKLILFINNINAALLLSQLIYQHEDGWIAKTYAEWEQELYLNEYRIRKAARLLESHGFIETKVKKLNGNPTLHYRVNWDTLTPQFLKFIRGAEGVSVDGR